MAAPNGTTSLVLTESFFLLSPVLVHALVRLELGLELGPARVERVEHDGADERANCPRRGLRESLPVHGEKHES